jgi:hypothetical protein
VPINLDAVTIYKGNLSNDQPDSFKTIMGKSTLDNYARKINDETIPLIVAHDYSTLPVGRVFQAEVKNNVLEAMFFIPKEGNEKITRDIEMGIVTDLSIGGGLSDESDVLCSKCSKSLRRAECRHIVGKKYEGKTVYGVIENAYANEASLVYKGSNPSTQIVSIVRMHNEGINSMDWELIFTRIGKKPETVDLSDDDNLGFIVDQIVELKRQVDEQKPLADVGKQYRADLIEEAKQARIKALGTEGWNTDNYVRVLGAADLDFIKSEKELYTAQANKALNNGEKPTNTIRRMATGNKELLPLDADDKPRKVSDGKDSLYS